MNEKSLFAVGEHRPVYLWAGPGTVRMNRLKFMGAPVDEVVHAEAHTEAGAARMAQEADFNWAYLMYDWGFPPEIEKVGHEDFRRAVAVYHDAGLRTFGYIQTSNCVYDGSYRGKDWYALDSKSRPFYYYTGRYMTCWRHPEWLEHMREMVRGVVGAGSDGVFFDNPWHGAQPIHFGGAWMGSAGCYCPRCRAAFREASGLEIPTLMLPETDEASRVYLRWRARQVAGTLATLTDYARSLNHDVVISVNDFDAVMRPSTLIYGIDLGLLSGVQDVIMIEDYGLPRWEKDLLVNNVLTLHTARGLIGDTPLSTNPYDKGIGFDSVYAPRRFRQGIAEAAACGAAMVVKGTEYVADGVFTLLTAERYAPQREAIGSIHRWLATHAALYRERENAARVGLLFPGDDLWVAWDQAAPPYFGTGQTLLAAGIPWRVVTCDDGFSALDVLFCFGEKPPVSGELRVIDVLDLPGWTPAPSSFLARNKAAHSLVSGVVEWLFRAYFQWRWARSLGDNLGLAHLFLQSPYFRLPPKPAQKVLLAALGERPYPRVESEVPVLVELWKQGETWQLHLVNYAQQPQPVVVSFVQPVSGRVLSPDGEGGQFHGTHFGWTLDVYAVIQYSLSGSS